MFSTFIKRPTSQVCKILVPFTYAGSEGSDKTVRSLSLFGAFADSTHKEGM